MMPLTFGRTHEKLSVLCLGAHSDDIEIGLGGTLLSWIEAGQALDVYWCVASAIGERAEEARSSANEMLTGAAHSQIELGSFRDSYFPYQGAELKAWMEAIKNRFPSPDIVFTHRRDDAHQDHRELCQLTWNAFRNHLVLEYEIPKWDGDLGQPNFYVPISAGALERKIRHLDAHFGSQRSKDWFDAETFRGLARLRGMECRAEERYAEAFVSRKACLLAAAR